MFDTYKRPGIKLFGWIIIMPGSKPSENFIGKARPWATGDVTSMELSFIIGETNHKITLTKHGHLMTFFDVFHGGTSNGRGIGEICEKLSSRGHLIQDLDGPVASSGVYRGVNFLPQHVCMSAYSPSSRSPHSAECILDPFQTRDQLHMMLQP